MATTADDIRLAESFVKALTTQALVDRLKLMRDEPAQWKGHHRVALLNEAMHRLTKMDILIDEFIHAKEVNDRKEAKGRAKKVPSMRGQAPVPKKNQD